MVLLLHRVRTHSVIQSYGSSQSSLGIFLPSAQCCVGPGRLRDSGWRKMERETVQERQASTIMKCCTQPTFFCNRCTSHLFLSQTWRLGPKLHFFVCITQLCTVQSQENFWCKWYNLARLYPFPKSVMET